MDHAAIKRNNDDKASFLKRFTRWLHLKQYQIEVTFSVYMFTPVEKFVFWSIVFLLVSLTFIATTLYLPQHIAFLLNRAWFYMHGESVDVIEITKEAVQAAAAAATGAGGEEVLGQQKVEL